MSKQLQLRRGTTVQHSSFTGAVGEVTVDTTKDTVVVHDGTTAGGFPLAKESAISGFIDLSDLSVTDSGGDGSLAYNNTTGVFTYTGPSASDVRAHFSAGTGITITTGEIAVDTSTIATPICQVCHQASRLTTACCLLQVRLGPRRVHHLQAAHLQDRKGDVRLPTFTPTTTTTTTTGAPGNTYIVYQNSRLEVWVDGVEVARFNGDGTLDLNATLGENAF
jgi:hypothetical protein